MRQAVVVPGSALQQLLAISTPALSTARVESDPGGSAELASMLARRNGFYAFESALHVRASTMTVNEHGLDEWNRPDLWRDAYPGLGDEWFFFGEDALGGQFALGSGGVSMFDPESGEVEPLAPSIELWAERILDDHEVLTAWPLAHDWQARNGPLRRGRRLVPKTPFMLGGAFDVANLYDAEVTESLRNRGEIASQMAGLPDGAAIQLRVIE